MLDRGQSERGSQRYAAPVENLGRGHARCDNQTSAAPSFSYLLLCADSLDDAERMRIALENRLRALEVGKVHASPGPSLAKARPYAHWQDQLQILVAFEHRAALELKRALRATSYAAFQTRTTGLGEKQFARLLAAIGDPYWNTTEDRPRRGPAELWAYCGYAPEQKRRKGVKSNWNAQAKMRAFLCAEKCMMQANTPYRSDYLERRAHTALVHPEWSKGHSHNDALRIVAKNILRDLWLEGRELATVSAVPVHRPPLAPTPSAQAIHGPIPKWHAPEPDLARAAA